MVECAAAAQCQHDQDDDDDDDDIETPVIGRSPAHLPPLPPPLPRSLSDVAGLHRRRSYAGSLEDALGASVPPSSCPPTHLRRTLAVADWLAGVRVDDGRGSGSVDDDDSLCDVVTRMDVSRCSSGADHGFISGLMTESAELDASRLALTSSVVPASSGIADDDDDRSHLLDGFRLVDGPCVRTRRMSTPCSADDAVAAGRWRWPRHRRYSDAGSAASSASDYEYRESLCSKGVSVDLGEDLEFGIVTPPSARPGGPATRLTVAGMESLHEALRQIQRDVDEMNRKFDGLRASTAAGAVDAAEHGETWSTTDTNRGHSAVQSACGEPSEAEDEDLSSERQQSDYMWDYRSDLVPEGAGHRFVALRPVVPSSSGNFVLHRTSLPRNYSDLCTEASTGCGTDDGMGDLYIDDDFGGTDAAVGEWAPEKFDTESQLSSDVLFGDGLEATLLQDDAGGHSTQVYNSCCSCCHHPVSCGHSDSCCVSVKRHCPSHCKVSSPQTRRSSVQSYPCCQHHRSNHIHHPSPWSTSHSHCCHRHEDDGGRHSNVAGTRPSLRCGCFEEWDCCNNAPRSSTPADDVPLPLDHCNNFRSNGSSSSITGRSFAETRPVGEKQHVGKVFDGTFSGGTALRQVCSDCHSLGSL